MTQDLPHTQQLKTQKASLFTCHIMPTVQAIGYVQQPITTNCYTHFQDNNLHYTGACFSHGASENSISVLDLHGEQSLGVSFMQKLRKTGEGRGKAGTGGQRSSIPLCKVQHEALPRWTINQIFKKKKKSHDHQSFNPSKERKCLCFSPVSPFVNPSAAISLVGT